MPKKKHLIIATAVITIALFAVWFGLSGKNDDEKRPLYWVAPMDPDYRRESPGKSPMGMDLIPVYEEQPAATNESGVITIDPQMEHQLGIRTEVVQRKRLRLTLRTNGQINFNRNLVVKISPRVTGWIDMLFATTEGEAVKRGQPLFSLYSPELIEAQEAFLTAFKAKNAAAVRNAESRLRALKMDETAISKLKSEGVAQQSVVFRAPKDGVIGMLNTVEDEYVEPGDLVMAIGSLESVWAELDVFASQASLIKPHQLMTLTAPAYPGLAWEGEIDYIYPAIDDRSKSLRFRSEIDNPKMRLKPNMQIQGLINLQEQEPQLLVSRQAVIDLGDQQRVVVALGDGKFKSVAITPGESNSEQIEVLDGLSEGDVIVTSAHFLIDSESSKTSDFLRIAPSETAEQSQYPPTWVNATIKDINLRKRELRLQHENIEAWKMPGMTMNFQVVADLNLHVLEIEDAVRVKVSDGDPLFLVTDIERLGTDNQP